MPKFERTGIPELLGVLAPKKYGTVAAVLGIRCAESLTRRRAVTCKSGFKAFISSTPFKHIRKAYPVYDWSNEDVWRVPKQMGWDYNQAYDVMQRRGIPVHSARCSPPFGDQPVKGLFKFNQCWPELWAKMTERVHGAATAGRYAHTMLYRRNIVEKPEGLTYKQWTPQMIDKLEGKAKIECQNGLKRMIKMHRNKSGDGSVLPDETPNPKSGLSWKLLTLYGVVGSDKLNRTTQRIGSQSISFREGNYLEKRKQAEQSADK